MAFFDSICGLHHPCGEERLITHSHQFFASQRLGGYSKQALFYSEWFSAVRSHFLFSISHFPSILRYAYDFWFTGGEFSSESIGDGDREYQ